MLVLKLSGDEFFDELKQEFVEYPAKTLCFEHSLVSLSKWESIHQVPFLDGKSRTPEEILSYVNCMLLDGELTDEDVLRLSSVDRLTEIIKYIESTQSATTFGIMPQTRGRGEIITSELIYYWMVAYSIPFECQTWHLNRLFSLIRICNVKQSKPKKMSRSELAAQARMLNEQRRRELGSNG